MIALQWYRTHVVKGQGALRLNVVANSESEARAKTETIFGLNTVKAVEFVPLESLWG